MHYFFISGTSRGIGKALAEELLKNQDNYVIGFSRTNVIKHERFEFISIDLSNTSRTADFKFINIIDADSITLVNNSGMVGTIAHIGLIDNQSIIDVFNVNIISPAILSNNFVKAYQHFKCRKLVLNISSGAAKYAIESWGAYCGSKSALELFTSVGQLEQNVLKQPFPVKFLAIAPGIVDTRMQEEIRQTNASLFSDVDKFIRYKEENKLLSPLEVAVKLVKLIENADKVQSSFIDLRELSFNSE